jgi:hypothetical protein
MDPLHFCIAVAPLAVYALMLAILNLSGRPFVTTGARDIAALGIGVSGLVVAGPMELFFPEGAAARFGPWVWLLLIVFYGLCISLTVLLMRPRLVVYNITIEQLRPMLTDVAMKADPSSRWTGDALIIPKLGVHVQVESLGVFRNVQLTSCGTRQNFDGWASLEKSLKAEIQDVKVGPNVLGIFLVGVSAVLTLVSGAWMVLDKTAVAQALSDMLRQ